MKREVWIKGVTVTLSGDELATIKRALLLAIEDDTRMMKREPPKNHPTRRSELAMTIVDETDVYDRINIIHKQLMDDAGVPQ